MARKTKTEYVVGPDLDLDEEEFILKDGRRLTNALADQMADETLAEVRRRNRPAPAFKVRTPRQVVQRL